MNFLAVFLEFSITCRLGTKRNDNFYFLSLSAFFLPILVRNEAIIVFFLFFLFFLLFFWNFLFRAGWERNGTIIIIFSLSQPFPTDYGLKWSQNGIFLIFRIFQLFFWNFKLRVWTERIGTIIFVFSLSRPSPIYFGLKRSQNGIFKFFEFVCYSFGIFYFASGMNKTER